MKRLGRALFILLVTVVSVLLMWQSLQAGIQGLDGPRGVWIANFFFFIVVLACYVGFIAATLFSARRSLD